MPTAAAASDGGFSSSRAAYAAAGWALLFAAMSFYWALGGRAGISTQAVGVRDQVEDPQFVAVLWMTGGLKVVAGLIALAFVLPAGRRMPRRLLLVVGWATAVVLVLYGGLGWVQAVLWETGVFDIPAAVGPQAARWKLLFWDPFWIVGGLLFLLAVRRFQVRPPA